MVFHTQVSDRKKVKIYYVVCATLAWMRVTTTDLTERAQSIFDQLGYTVVGDGRQFRAERDWKVVDVLATKQPIDVPETGSLRAFVTPAGRAATLRQRLRERDPDYEWAVIGIKDDDDDYEVERAPPGPQPQSRELT